jgi:hypothetical protein
MSDTQHGKIQSDGEQNESEAATGAGAGAAEAGAEREARIELLEEQNRRLREEYARAQRSQYRRTALGMGVIGVFGFVGGFVFPGYATVFFSFGGIGVFAAVLTYFLTPEQFLPASIGSVVYESMAANQASLVDNLGLSDARVYVPVGADGSVRIYVPQMEEFTIPDLEHLTDGVLVVPTSSERGLSLRPTGGPLTDEFTRLFDGPLPNEVAPLSAAISDALVEQFELVEMATPESSADDVVIGLQGVAFSQLDRFDHPVCSFVATTTAVALGQPCTVSVSDGDDRFDGVVVVSPLEQ